MSPTGEDWVASADAGGAVGAEFEAPLGADIASPGSAMSLFGSLSDGSPEGAAALAPASERDEAVAPRLAVARLKAMLTLV